MVNSRMMPGGGKMMGQTRGSSNKLFYVFRAILAENGDFLKTEDGDFLVTEDS